MDDGTKNLELSNADVKVMFSEYNVYDCEWNKGFVGLKCSTFEELFEIILKYI